MTTVRVVIAAHATTMGVTSLNINNLEVLDLLEEEMVPWEFWRP